MKFWDASAIVPLLMTEPTSNALQRLAAEDQAMLVWWATEAWPAPLARKVSC